MANHHKLDNAPKLSKKRKLGKNKKKSWRVAKVQDIEEFLDEEQLQIRTGGLVAEKSDETLFVLDTVSSKPTQQTGESEGPSKSKRARKDRPLKCLAHLQPDPHSKPVRTEDPDTFRKGKRTGRIIDRLRSRSQSQVRQQAEQVKQRYTVTRKVEVEATKQLPIKPVDLWASDAVSEKETNKRIKPPKRYRTKPSALPATVIPHPGASMNPAYDDHQDLLREAHLAEEKKVKKTKKIHNALDAKFPDKSEAPNESTYLTEMSAGLVTDSEDEEENDVGEDVALSVNPPVRREDRKTKKQRRNEMESKLKAKDKISKMDVKLRENKLLRLPTIKAEINEAMRKQNARAELKRKQKEQEPFQTKRLNRMKFEEPDLALKLSSELRASYREMKPEGHLMNDIYKSVQRRNIVEPRTKQKVKRKYKPKTFEKKGHKAVTL